MLHARPFLKGLPETLQGFGQRSDFVVVPRFRERGVQLPGLEVRDDAADQIERTRHAIDEKETQGEREQEHSCEKALLAGYSGPDRGAQGFEAPAHRVVEFEKARLRQPEKGSDRLAVCFRRDAVVGGAEDCVERRRHHFGVVSVGRGDVPVQRNGTGEGGEGSRVLPHGGLAAPEVTHGVDLLGSVRGGTEQETQHPGGRILDGDSELQDSKAEQRERGEFSRFVPGDEGDALHDPLGFAEQRVRRMGPLVPRHEGASLRKGGFQSRVGGCPGFLQGGVSPGEGVHFRIVAGKENRHERVRAFPRLRKPRAGGGFTNVRGAQEGDRLPAFRNDGDRGVRQAAGCFVAGFERPDRGEPNAGGRESAMENHSHREQEQRDGADQENRDSGRGAQERHGRE